MDPGGEQLVQILSFQLLKPFGKVVLQLDKFIGGNRRCNCFLQLSFGIKPQISHLAAIHFQMTLQKQTNKEIHGSQSIVPALGASESRGNLLKCRLLDPNTDLLS